MVANYEQYQNVEIVHWVPMGKGEYCLPKMKGHLRHNAMFVGKSTREAVQSGPCGLHSILLSSVHPLLFGWRLPH